MLPFKKSGSGGKKGAPRATTGNSTHPSETSNPLSNNGSGNRTRMSKSSIRNSQNRQSGSSHSRHTAQHLTGEAPSDDFSARRSSRVAAGRYVADNDTWIEALAVCELPKNGNHSKGAKSSKSSNSGGILRKLKPKNSEKSSTTDNSGVSSLSSSAVVQDAEIALASQRLALRPYFQSQNTGQRVWDEPPSGASRIVYATAEARKMAQAQLEEMRASYAHAAVLRKAEKDTLPHTSSSEPDQTKNIKSILPRGKPKMFKMPSISGGIGTPSSAGTLSSTPLAESNNTPSSQFSKSNKTSSSFPFLENGVPPSVIKESTSTNEASNMSSYERDLQMAMLMSMGVGGGSVMGAGDSSSASRQNAQTAGKTAGSVNRSLTREEQEQLALATALSLSEEEAKKDRRRNRSYERGNQASTPRNQPRSNRSGSTGRAMSRNTIGNTHATANYAARKERRRSQSVDRHRAYSDSGQQELEMLLQFSDGAALSLDKGHSTIANGTADSNTTLPGAHSSLSLRTNNDILTNVPSKSAVSATEEKLFPGSRNSHSLSEDEIPVRITQVTQAKREKIDQTPPFSTMATINQNSNCEQLLSFSSSHNTKCNYEHDDSFDGGGKMPALQDRSHTVENIENGRPGFLSESGLYYDRMSFNISSCAGDDEGKASQLYFADTFNVSGKAYDLDPEKGSEANATVLDSSPGMKIGNGESYVEFGEFNAFKSGREEAKGFAEAGFGRGSEWELEWINEEKANLPKKAPA